MSHVLVTGASGLIGSHLYRRLLDEGHDVVGTYHEGKERVPQVSRGGASVALDLDDDASIEAAFRAAWPEVVVHCAAMSDLRSCEAAPATAQRRNVQATAKLARLSAAFGARFLFCSTDQVFDGERGGYRETDEARPRHEYGRSKLLAEEEIRREHKGATSLRIALVYGRSPSGDRSASEKVVLALRGGDPPRLFVDEIRTPILVDDVARLIIDLFPERDLPVVHLAGPDALSRHEFGVKVANAHGLDAGRIEAVRLADLDLMPPRPPCLSLDIERLRACVKQAPSGVDEGLARLLENEEAATR